MLLLTTSDESPIGLIHKPGALNIDELKLSNETMRDLFRIDINEWRGEVSRNRSFFDNFKNRLPAGIVSECDKLFQRLDKVEKARQTQ